MKILITNDDGIDFNGISILKDTLEKEGHEVWICAPEGARSASSHAISIYKKIKIKKIEEKKYSCSGYPADCVLFAVKGAIPVKPDVIISGVNDGYNLSSDVLYSGTVGAAREGAINRIPAIAVSSERTEEAIIKASRFVCDNLETLILFCDDTSFVNINVPSSTDGKTWKIGKLGILEYYDNVNEIKKESVELDGEINYILQGSAPPQMREFEDDTDFCLVEKGIISITILSVLPKVDGNKSILLTNKLSK